MPDVRWRRGFVEVMQGPSSYMEPGARVDGPGRVVAWRKGQEATELVREPAQTGWRENWCTVNLQRQQREEADHRQQSWAVITPEYNLPYAKMSPSCLGAG